MLNIGQDRDRSAPVTLPPPGIEKVKVPASESEKKVADEKAAEPKNFKNRIESWAKSAEQDAEKAETYLDKKREIKGAKKSSVTNIVPETDVMKAMEVVEDASGLREQANPRKKTPPGGMFHMFEPHSMYFTVTYII